MLLSLIEDERIDYQCKCENDMMKSGSTISSVSSGGRNTPDERHVESGFGGSLVNSTQKSPQEKMPFEVGEQVYYEPSNGQEAELSSDYSSVDIFVPELIFPQMGASFAVVRLTTRCQPAWVFARNISYPYTMFGTYYLAMIGKGFLIPISSHSVRGWRQCHWREALRSSI